MAKKAAHKKFSQNIENEILPPLLFPARNKSEGAWHAELRRLKKIRKIGPRLYTSVPRAEVETVVRSQWAQIIAQLYPKVQLSHRSALEYKPSPQNEIVLTSTTNRRVCYPGLTLEFLRGPKAFDDDPSVFGFRSSSQARAFLENFSSGKSTSRRTLSRAEVEIKLESILRAKGEVELNKIREHARKIAKTLRWHREFIQLNQMIGALLGSKSESALISAVGRARARKRPYDVARVARFDILLGELLATPLTEYKENFFNTDHFHNKAFFEAYFSNYIEGTTFEIKEAEEIVFDNKIPSNRPKDAHDILGTFEIVSNPNEMRKTPQTLDALEEILKNRHRILMMKRAEAMPGEFKDRPNRAGETHFVHPDEIKGTFEKGFERYQDLPVGLARAIFMMFMVAEIHPFTDGNGRIARIMMNAELHAQKLSTIIIPTVYREDYLSALRALTRRDRPDPLIRMLARAHHFSNLEFSKYRATLETLENKNWFREPHMSRIIE